jgi:hypothetical protein
MISPRRVRHTIVAIALFAGAASANGQTAVLPFFSSNLRGPKTH